MMSDDLTDLLAPLRALRETTPSLPASFGDPSILAKLDVAKSLEDQDMEAVNTIAKAYGIPLSPLAGKGAAGPAALAASLGVQTAALARHAMEDAAAFAQFHALFDSIGEATLAEADTSLQAQYLRGLWQGVRHVLRTEERTADAAARRATAAELRADAPAAGEAAAAAPSALPAADASLVTAALSDPRVARVVTQATGLPPVAAAAEEAVTDTEPETTRARRGAMGRMMQRVRYAITGKVKLECLRGHHLVAMLADGRSLREQPRWLLAKVHEEFGLDPRGYVTKPAGAAELLGDIGRLIGQRAAGEMNQTNDPFAHRMLRELLDGKRTLIAHGTGAGLAAAEAADRAIVNALHQSYNRAQFEPKPGFLRALRDRMSGRKDEHFTIARAKR